MSTALFNSIIFGPIKSRRLGNSLGVNLLPAYGKFCNFDCIYCECGWNQERRDDNRLPSFDEVAKALEYKLIEAKEVNTPIDTITFSGNGEPTLHPDFEKIIDKTIELRDCYFPNAKVSVLSNASMLAKESVVRALKRIDNPILKIDSTSEEIVNIINRPAFNYSLAEIKSRLAQFNGDFILQTMFLRGEIEGKFIDSTSPELTEKWIELVRELSPRRIMMYTIDRDTPLSGLQKVSVEEMERIAAPLIADGFDIQIKG